MAPWPHIVCREILRPLVLALFLGGCAAAPPQRLVFDRFTGAYRLTNGTVQVTVVPQIGRVVSYSKIDGSGQMLWWNPAIDRQAQRVNWGGDKAWPWPQHHWTGIWGGDWPPPPVFDQGPYTVTHADVRRLRMISGVEEQQGLRMQIEVALDDQGTGVTMRYTLIRARPAPGPDWSAWSVTQVPIPDILLARIPADRDPEVQAMSHGRHWKAVTQVAGNVLKFERDPTTKAKLGVDADRFLAVYGDKAIGITLDPATTAGSYLPAEKGQLYVTADKPEPAPPGVSFLELEFTSPRLPLARVGDQVTLVTRWELHHRPGATLADWVRIAGNQAH